VHDCQPTHITNLGEKKEKRKKQAIDGTTLFLSLFLSNYFSFLFFSCLQGFQSFAWMAIFYQMKDELKPSPSVSQFLVSAAFIPLSVKPMIYGYVFYFPNLTDTR
jgi:hypothetical protein